MNIGEKIKSLRQKEGLTTRELAELCKINYSQLAKIERGVNIPTLGTAERILKHFGYKIEFTEISPKED